MIKPDPAQTWDMVAQFSGTPTFELPPYTGS